MLLVWTRRNLAVIHWSGYLTNTRLDVGRSRFGFRSVSTCGNRRKIIVLLGQVLLVVVPGGMDDSNDYRNATTSIRCTGLTSLAPIGQRGNARDTLK